MDRPDPAEISAKLNCVSRLCPGRIVYELERPALVPLLARLLRVDVAQVVEDSKRPHLYRKVETGDRCRRDCAEMLVVVRITDSDFIDQIGPHGSDHRE